jgi:DNA invertase Pin-like site-specific DNA recombinase
MDDLRKVAIYLRVSTQDQQTHMQRKDILEFVRKRGWKVFQIYDEKRSGFTDRRPEYQQMMSDARRRRFDILVTWRLDRLFRSVKGLLNTIDELSALNIDFVSLNDQMDMTTPSGRLMLTVLGAVAEMERAILLERVKAGVAHAKAKGVRFGRPVTRPDAKIHQLRRDGLSIRKIAKELNVATGTVERSLSHKVP